MVKPWAVSVLLLLAMSFADRAAAENPIFEQLIRQGVAVSPGETVRLPAPSLADGLTATAQRKVIEAIAGERHTWDSFTRRAVVTPFVLKISQDDASDQRIGRRVDLWFVAYGDLRSLGSDEFLNRQFKSAVAADAENSARVRLLTNSDLAQRGLAPPQNAEDSRYLAAEFTLLERVRLSATTRSVKTETQDSIMVASVLDPRFTEDAEFPNRWQSITRDDAGRRKLGAPQPYTGLGSYVKATRLSAPEGALFIEYHVAFAEPRGWFNGANLLRSKLPIVAQDAVRKFRRSLDPH